MPGRYIWAAAPLRQAIAIRTPIRTPQERGQSVKQQFALTALAALALSGCVTTDMRMGAPEAKTVATGAAGGANAENANTELERCESSLGTVSLVENQTAGWYTILTQQYRLPPTSQLLRLMIQQSNCFVVVERGAAGMNAMVRERALMQAGEMRGGSNMGGGQMVASDYALSPEVIFNQNDAGGMGGALGGRMGGVFGALAAGTKTREASVMLTLVDNRSGVQVSASEGSSSKTDWGGMGALFGGTAGGALGGYTKTAEGKVISAAFMDAYNQMVKALRNYKAQTVKGQGLGGGGRLGVDGGAAPSQTSAPGAGAAAAGGAMMPLKAAQQKLNDLGYNAGSPDGAMGRGTQNALRTFQKDQGLPQTGRLDRATSQALSAQ